MKFGLFYEHQYPRPWETGGESRLFHEALEQVELADRLGIDHAWEVEHHFLEEYSHSSAPEVFLAAASQRTKRIRLSHGITLLPPPYNQPYRIAERIATLDVVSDGRVDFGTGESASRIEMEGAGLDPADRRPMWMETIEQIANMFVMDPYPGFKGKYFSMPPRNVVPKPVQKPHPPLWVACGSRDTIHLAAQLGLGALTFAFIDADEAKKWVDDYYETLKRECVPIGHSVNPNIAIVTGFSLHEDEQQAINRGIDGLRFFQYSLGHYFFSNEIHKPGRTDVWANYMERRPELLKSDLEQRTDGSGSLTAARGCIGTPRQVSEYLRSMSGLGMDQVIFIQQGGKNRHEDICSSLELFAAKVMPEFHGEEEARQQRKMAELQPYIEEAFKRKQYMAPLADSEIPEYEAWGPGATQSVPSASR